MVVQDTREFGWIGKWGLKGKSMLHLPNSRAWCKAALPRGRHNFF